MGTNDSSKWSYLLVPDEPTFAIPDRKPTAYILGADVGAVLNDDVLLDAADQPPELLLHQLCGDHLEGHAVEITNPTCDSENSASRDNYGTCAGQAAFTYMNGHVEVVGFELVSHLSETLQGVLPHCLLETERLPGLVALLWREETQCLVILPACCLWEKDEGLEGC